MINNKLTLNMYNVKAWDTTSQLADRAMRQDLRDIISRQDLHKFNTPAELKFEIEKQYHFSPEIFDVVDEVIRDNNF